MPIRVSDALSWQVDDAESRLSAVRAGITATNDVADRLRDDAERVLDGMEGQSVDAARTSVQDLRRRTFALGDDLRSTANPLSSFARSVAIHRDRLRASVEAVLRQGATVAEDGSVVCPPDMEANRVRELRELEVTIEDALRAIDSLDVETADKLTRLYETIADHSNNADLRTTVAGVVINAMTGPLGDLIRAGDDGLPGTRAVAKGLGPFGSALGLAASIAGAPNDEPMSETLIAEGGGFVAGLAMAAGYGAAAGSVVPGAGTVAGAAFGIILTAGASFVTSSLVRDHFDDQRQGR